MPNELSPIQQELLNRADSVIVSISNVASSAVEFSKEQFPDIAIQYITFYRWYYSSIEFTFAIFIILGLWLTVYMACKDIYKLGLDRHGCWEASRSVVLVIGLIIILSGIICAVINLKNLFLVWFAPKFFIIQTISNIIQQ